MLHAETTPSTSLLHNSYALCFSLFSPKVLARITQAYSGWQGARVAASWAGTAELDALPHR